MKVTGKPIGVGLLSLYLCVHNGYGYVKMPEVTSVALAVGSLSHHLP